MTTSEPSPRMTNDARQPKRRMHHMATGTMRAIPAMPAVANNGRSRRSRSASHREDVGQLITRDRGEHVGQEDAARVPFMVERIEGFLEGSCDERLRGQLRPDQEVCHEIGSRTHDDDGMVAHCRRQRADGGVPPLAIRSIVAGGLGVARPDGQNLHVVVGPAAKLLRQVAARLR